MEGPIRITEADQEVELVVRRWYPTGREAAVWADAARPERRIRSSQRTVEEIGVHIRRDVDAELENPDSVGGVVGDGAFDHADRASWYVAGVRLQVVAVLYLSAQRRDRAHVENDRRGVGARCETEGEEQDQGDSSMHVLSNAGEIPTRTQMQDQCSRIDANTLRFEKEVRG